MRSVSVIMVSYNSGSTIENSILSFLQQTYIHKELIIIDGGSTDNTIDIIRKYEKSLRYLSEKDNGIYDAMNKGILHARGEILGFLNSDDIYYADDSLETIMNVFNTDDFIDGVYSNLFYLNKISGNILRYWKSTAFKKYYLYVGWSPPHPTFYFKRQYYHDFSFATDYKISGDYELLLRIFQNSAFKFHFINKVTVKMASGGTSNKNLHSLITKTKEDFRATKVLTSIFPLRLVIIFLKNFKKLNQFNSNKFEQ